MIRNQLTYAPFRKPKTDFITIYQNIFLVDKETEIDDLVVMNKHIGYIISILPNPNEYNKCVKVGLEHSIMIYDGHDSNVDYSLFDKQCEKIEECKQLKKNVVVFCNNGYQRSLPFLCYYLMKYHNSRFPTIESTVDHIIPLIKKFETNIPVSFTSSGSEREGIIKNITKLIDITKIDVKQTGIFVSLRRFIQKYMNRKRGKTFEYLP